MKKPATGAPVPKAKTHHHVKPVHVTAAVKAKRHAAAVKASKTRAANAKKAKRHPRRQLALGEGVACCSAEALAASLRLAGVPVSDGDVLALYWRTADDEDAGASILATLEAVAEFGLAGVRGTWAATPVRNRFFVPFNFVSSRTDRAMPVVSGAEQDPVILAAPDDHPLYGQSGHAGVMPGAPRGECLPGHALILGVDLPGPHAVLATADGWRSWGELYDPAAFPDAVIEEAWEVTWPGIR